MVVSGGEVHKQSCLDGPVIVGLCATIVTHTPVRVQVVPNLPGLPVETHVRSPFGQVCLRTEMSFASKVEANFVTAPFVVSQGCSGTLFMFNYGK